MPVGHDELSLNLTYKVYKGQEHLFSSFVLAGVVTDCTYELSVKQHFISFKNTGVPREGISKKCTENHQEDMHHANLFLFEFQKDPGKELSSSSLSISFCFL